MTKHVFAASGRNGFGSGRHRTTDTYDRMSGFMATLTFPVSIPSPAVRLQRTDSAPLLTSPLGVFPACRTGAGIDRAATGNFFEEKTFECSAVAPRGE